MDNITTDFGNVFLWSFWIFVVVGALTLWVLAFVDLFADHTWNGWAKAGWALLLIFVPWVGVLAYLVVREIRIKRLAHDIGTDAV